MRQFAGTSAGRHPSRALARTTPGNAAAAHAFAPAAQGSAAAADGAVRFTVWVLLASLLLQRFAIPIGELPLSVVGPIGLLCGAYWTLRGVLALDRRRVAALLVIAAMGCLSSIVSMAGTTARLAAISWTSLAQFLLLSSFALLAFREPVDEERFFRAVNRWLFFVGVAGILQFFAQFAGISIFGFSDHGFPIRYTQEYFYNTVQTAGASSVIKANGFFLLEASIYSQMAAMGLCIELVFFRRLRHLAVFGLSLVVAVSGTGLMVLGAFVVGAVISMGARGAAVAAGALAVTASALGALALAQPDLFAYFIGRVSEFSSPGSSAHLRFVTPFWALSDVLDETPLSLLIGGGAGASERLYTQLAYAYNINTPLKIVVEYGLPGLVAYLALFLAADRTPRQSALMMPAMTLFLFTGAYSQFAPILFPILLITSVARLRPAGKP
jgi:hypothetical protein